MCRLTSRYLMNIKHLTIVAGLVCMAALPVASAAPKKSSGNALPNGKPFQYLNNRIDSLQSQINLLIGRVDSLEGWQIRAEAALLKLEQQAAANAEAIALLQSEIDDIKLILATKQDIIDQSCPDNQFAYQVLSGPGVLVCRADVGANGLKAYTVEVAQDIPDATSADVVAQCPDGTVAMGGSYNSAPNLTITSAGLANNSYSVSVANTSGTRLPLTVTATCLGIAK